MRFSEKHGYTEPRTVLQFESMDDALRNGLWDVVCEVAFGRIRANPMGGIYLSENPQLRNLVRALWHSFFKRPLDTMRSSWALTKEELRTEFYGSEWFQVYDFIEFTADAIPEPETFRNLCNRVLEREMAAYRFVGTSIAPITNDQELSAIDEALRCAEEPVRAHLKRAVERISNRKDPDYRNSVKESISAVEALVKRTMEDRNGNLGGLLGKMTKEHELHPAFGGAFAKLYGYTSDAGGIRHALLDADKVDFDDAKFFLVTCSAFVNFVTGKLQA